MAETRHHVEPDNPDVHHEESDINVRAALIGIAIFIVFAVIMHFGLWGMFVGFRKIDRSLDPEPVTRIETPAPSGEGNEFTSHWWEPAEYLEQIREQDRRILEEYGWVNRPAGKVHVPIEVGMAMALERGFATRPGEPTVTGGGELDPHQPWESHVTREGTEPEGTVEGAEPNPSSHGSGAGTATDSAAHGNESGGHR